MPPSITIVSVPREQFGRARLSVQSILDSTAPDAPIIYVDGNAPPELSRDVAATRSGVAVIRKDHYLSGNVARNLALAQVHTRYVLFVDNDVQMWPGSIDALVKCAEETGAWIVGPLYCIGAPGGRQVHAAHTEVRVVEEHGRRHLRELKTNVGEPANKVRAQLGRVPTDEVEFHCLLARTELFEALGPLDEGFLVAFDHVDLCLSVRKANHPIYLETAATVTYMPPPPIALSDLPFFLLRWSEAWYRSSLQHLCEKWQLDPDDEVFRDHEKYRTDHRARLLTRSAQMNRMIEGSLGKILENTLVRNLEHQTRRRETDRLHTY
ncbi:MAG TPA: glycosyltransferase [Candidatus Binataceae bacterium]|nr:glycosyltransferase [Candidatus Binataceae bacterium]